jgi:hypothetical protein
VEVLARIYPNINRTICMSNSTLACFLIVMVYGSRLLFIGKSFSYSNLCALEIVVIRILFFFLKHNSTTQKGHVSSVVKNITITIS